MAFDLPALLTLENLKMKDLRYALRMLFKRPGLTALTIMTLGLGIGANTIIFSGVYALLLQSPPYPDAERLMIISQTSPTGAETGLSYPDFSEWKEQSISFDRMAASKNINVNLTDRFPVERVEGSMVTEDFFSTLGIRPLAGRHFVKDDFLPPSAKTVILSYVFWQRKFGGSDVTGKQLRLNDEPFTIIGVMPDDFQYPFRSRFWLPLAANEKPEKLADRASMDYQIIASLKADTGIDQAKSELTVLAHRSFQLKAKDEEMSARVVSLSDSLPGRAKYRAPLIALQLAVLMVLLIASVNLANLLLAQATERRQEFAVRLAMGATRGRILRQMLTESFLLALMGTAAGLLMAGWGVGALRSVSWRIPGMAEVEINAAVLLATLSVSSLTSLIFGLAPALTASRQDLNEILKSSPASDPRRRRLSKSLVVAEVAMAVALLAASGLMIRTFLNLTDESPGFDTRGAVAVSLALPRPAYPTYQSVEAYFTDAMRRIKNVPGVERVGGVTYAPLIGYNPGADFTIEGRDTQPALGADFQPVTADYFSSIGMPLLRGRAFTEADMKASPEVAVINQALAKKYWEDEDPLGKRIQIKGLASPVTITGIVGDVKQFGLHTDPRPEIYAPMYRHSMTLIARANASTARLLAALEEAVQQDSRAAVSVKSIEEFVADSIERRRVFAQLMTSLAATALALAMMGLYGVTSYSVSQRTREIGIRMAMGAYRRDVMRLVIGQALRLAAGGLTIGLILSFALARVFESMLYRVSAIDPVTIIALSLIMMALAAAASFIPARRATKVDPMTALRHE
jgi:putative ABC transport system permease protein